MKRLLVVIALVAIGVSAVPAVAAATPGSVTFHVVAALAGNTRESSTSGTFQASGAVTASGTEQGQGRFSGLGHLRTGYPNSLHSTMTFTDAHGTTSLELVGLFSQLPAPVATGAGRWWITGGTGAHAGILGEGSWTGSADFRAAIAGTGPPIVAFVDQGQVE